MSKLGLFCLIAWAVFGGYYLGKASAYRDFTEYNALMNLKMRQCIELITSGKK